MQALIWIGIFLATFSIMEFMAWFTHKYIMHGFLWSLHRDHHKKDHDSWFERNDAFFIFYAVVSMSFIMSAVNTDFWQGWPIGLGILAYGIAYFLVHHRLCGRGLISFIVAATSVTNQIDHDIFFKFVAIISG